MAENEQLTDQIHKIQTDNKLIAIYDRLRYAPVASYAQLHAKGDYYENNHKVNSLICVQLQDYSKGTGERNVIARFNLAPEQIQFFLTRIEAGFQEYEWSQSKIYGNPDSAGYSPAMRFIIARHAFDRNGTPMKNPWRIEISNGKGIKISNTKGGFYMKPGSYIEEKTVFIQLTDMDLFTLLKRTDSYITEWEHWISSFLISNGKQALYNQAQQKTFTQMPYAA